MVNTQKKDKISNSEKIANDFLLQLAYAVVSCIGFFFLYNARLFHYGNAVGIAMEKGNVLWWMSAAMLAVGIAFLLLWKYKTSNGWRIAAIYALVTAGQLLWLAAGPIVTYYINRLIPIFPHINAKRVFEVLFLLIGVSVVAEIAVYVWRMSQLKNKHKNPRKK